MTYANAAERPGAAREGLLARYPLVFFFLIAYAGTWLLSLPVALSEDGAGLLPFSSPLLVIAVFAIGPFLGPTLSAFVMTGITEGRAGIRRLLRRYVLWRVGLQWYLFALIGPPVIILLATIVLPGALASFQTLAPMLAPLLLLVNFAVTLVLGAPLGEEPGWRGFALPRLQRLHGPLVGTLILGPLWALWHLPLFWVTAWGTPPTILNMVLFVLAVIFMTIVFTWVFNNTKGSLLLAVLLHTSFNTFVGPVGEIFPAPIVTGYGGAVPMVIGLGAAALLLVVSTRGRLGYQHYTDTVSERQHEDEIPRTP